MIEQYLGISSDYVIIGMAAVIIILLILSIINIVQAVKLKNHYKIFMSGKDAKSLEDSLSFRWDQIDELVEANAANERNIDLIFKRLIPTFQKFGIVKYDALSELGGKLSFSLAMLDEKNDGYILNVVHSREGCYSYIKEIINGNSVIALAEEEEEALKNALENNG